MRKKKKTELKEIVKIEIHLTPVCLGISYFTKMYNTLNYQEEEEEGFKKWC